MKIGIAEQRKEYLCVKNPVSFPRSHELIVATPFPFQRVFHFSRSYHVEIDVHKAIPEITAAIDHRARIPVFPVCPLPSLPPIVVLGAPALEKMH